MVQRSLSFVMFGPELTFLRKLDHVRCLASVELGRQLTTHGLRGLTDGVIARMNVPFGRRDLLVTEEPGDHDARKPGISADRSVSVTQVVEPYALQLRQAGSAFAPKRTR